MAGSMTTAGGDRGPASPRPVSALPSVQARVLAFGAIIIGGLCGGLIGFSTTRVGCHGSCGTPEGVGSMIGAVVAAAGVAIIAVLVLRAMGEWRSIKETRQMELMIAAASQALGRPTRAGDPPGSVGEESPGEMGGERAPPLEVAAAGEGQPPGGDAAGGGGGGGPAAPGDASGGAGGEEAAEGGINPATGGAGEGTAGTGGNAGSGPGDPHSD
jgi:hypothetical protein